LGRETATAQASKNGILVFRHMQLWDTDFQVQGIHVVGSHGQGVGDGDQLYHGQIHLKAGVSNTNNCPINMSCHSHCGED
jgi:hypothetical protein